jgi:hypothetical protein
MDKEWKDRWVTALRSGKYEQGQSQLATLYTKHNTKYCCLGVLCNIHPDVRAVKRTKSMNDDGVSLADGTGWIEYHYGKESNLDRIPTVLREKLNIDVIDEDRLINMNDGEGVAPASFELIADYIEKEM